MSIVAEVAVGLAAADLLIIGTAVGVGVGVKLYKRRKRRQLVKKLTSEVFRTEEEIEDEFTEVDEKIIEEMNHETGMVPYSTFHYHQDIHTLDPHHSVSVADEDFEVDFENNLKEEESDTPTVSKETRPTFSKRLSKRFRKQSNL